MDDEIEDNDPGEKLREKARLTVNGVGAIAVGAPALLIDGFAHLGIGGLVVAGLATFLAAKHTGHAKAIGGNIMGKLVHVPESDPRSSSRGRDETDGRTMGEKLLGRSANPKRNVTQPSKDRANISDDSILIGTDTRRKQIYRTLKELKSMLITGLAEGGKTWTAAWIIAQCIQKGASIVIIDRHGRSDESLTARLSPFESFFACEPARLAKDALNNALFVKDELDSRIYGDSACDIPLVLVIDEFSEIMRQVAQKRGEWLQVGDELVSLIEAVNTQGRKYKVFVVAIGQIANASRSGGTEVRDLFHTRMLHGMRESQAAMLLPKEYRAQAARLEKGQIILDMEGKDDPFMVQIPLLSQKEMLSIAKQCQDRIIKQSSERDDVREEEDEDQMDDLPLKQGEGTAVIIGIDNRTKQAVCLPKQTFDVLARMRQQRKIGSFRDVLDLVSGITETHARNIIDLIDNPDKIREK